MSSFLDLSVDETLPWLAADGPAADMVISTQGRLARNLSAHEFPHQAAVSVKQTVSEELLAVMKNSSALKQKWALELGSLSLDEQALLRERHLTGPGVSETDDHRHLVVSSSGAATALINAEDHLRLYARQSGFQPQEVLADLLKLEEVNCHN